MERFKVTDVANYESKANGYSYTTCMIEDQWSKMAASFKGEVNNRGAKLSISIERVDIPAFTSQEAADSDGEKWILSCKDMIGFLLNGTSVRRK